MLSSIFLVVFFNIFVQSYNQIVAPDTILILILFSTANI